MNNSNENDGTLEMMMKDARCCAVHSEICRFWWECVLICVWILTTKMKRNETKLLGQPTDQTNERKQNLLRVFNEPPQCEWNACAYFVCNNCRICCQHVCVCALYFNSPGMCFGAVFLCADKCPKEREKKIELSRRQTANTLIRFACAVCNLALPKVSNRFIC